jgi:hypothetical protein
MKRLARAMLAGLSLVTIAMLSQCGGGSSAPQQSLPLAIGTPSLPNGMLNAPYSQTIQASGGVAPFSWSLSGVLPPNLALVNSAASTTRIYGTPDAPAQAAAFTIKVTDSTGQSATQSYTVSILAEPDTLTLWPAGLSFAPQLTGTLSAPQAETLTNTGTSAVTISSVGLTGTDAVDFSQNNTCGSNLAAGAICVINVTFTPSQLGPLSSSLTIIDSTLGSPHSVSLSGTALTSGPNADLSASVLTFANQVVDTSSPARSITISNYGTTTLGITGITASSNFGQTNTCNSTLASGESCTVNVTFTPDNTGSFNGTLSCADNAPDSPQTVSLSGNGVTPCIPQGGACYGPAHPTCCAAPRGHHAYCSNPTGEGTCVED